MTEVTEFDLRAPEFKHPSVKPEDFERRADGAIVRKDRWVTGMHQIAEALDLSTRSFEIQDVIDAAHEADAARDALNETYAALATSAERFDPIPAAAAGDPEGCFLTGKLQGRLEGTRAALAVLIDFAASNGYIFK